MHLLLDLLGSGFDWGRESIELRMRGKSQFLPTSQRAQETLKQGIYTLNYRGLNIMI